jgi:hypothetical protein
MSEAAAEARIWTAWPDYAASGEGRSIMACIAYADSTEQMKAQFSKHFGPMFAAGCEMGEGVVRNEVTQLLWSDTLLVSIESSASKRTAVDAHSWMHFNLA